MVNPSLPERVEVTLTADIYIRIDRIKLSEGRRWPSKENDISSYSHANSSGAVAPVGGRDLACHLLSTTVLYIVKHVPHLERSVCSHRLQYLRFFSMLWFRILRMFIQPLNKEKSRSYLIGLLELKVNSEKTKYMITSRQVDPGGPVVIILASGSEVRGFDLGRGRWIFSERKNPEYDFLRKVSKAVGHVA